MSEKTRGHADTDMLWWPHQQYQLISILSPGQIKEKLDRADEHVVYTGTYTKAGIRIFEGANFKIGAHSRSFKPEAFLVSMPGGAEGKHHYRVIIAPRIASVLILTLIVLVIIASIVFAKRDDLFVGKYKDVIIAGICVLLMSYALPVITFNAHLSNLKLFIDDLLEVEP